LQLVLHAQQCSQNIRVECRGVGFGGLVGERPWLTPGAGVVHKDVEPAEAGYRMVDEVSDIVFATHIGLHELCICS
jgi:hypothetical protein